MNNAMFDIDQTWINSIIWRAVYRDGKALYEVNADGHRNRYEDIDRYRLKRFDLLDGDKKRIYSFYPRTDRQLIFRRRRFFKGYPGDNNPQKWTVIVVGWHQLVRFKATNGEEYSKSLKAISYIYPNKTIDFDDDRSDLVIREQEVV